MQAFRIEYRVDGEGDILAAYETGSIDEIEERYQSLGFVIVQVRPVTL